MEPPIKAGKQRWGQTRRLAFIDFRLQYEGRINRRDLISFFEISTPQASADLSLYQSLAPGNVRYDPSSRVYVALDSFRPHFGRTAASSYLNDIHQLARGVIDVEESFVGFVPPTGVVATPARAVEASEVAIVVQAIRDRTALQVSYQSMDDSEPGERVIAPHAIGFDGLRWHVRAWCYTRGIFRDFAIGRLEVMGVERRVAGGNPETDLGWATQVTIILVPHPKLSPPQREAVIRDYAMVNGRLLLPCRKAMVFYTLRHLNLDSPLVLDDPARQHVVIQNRAEVDLWVTDDRSGTVPL